MSKPKDEQKEKLLSDSQQRDVEPLPDSDAIAAQKAKLKQKLLTISFFSMVFVGLGNKVFNKLMTAPMHNYPFFLSTWTSFVYIPVCFTYIFICFIFFPNVISAEERKVPQYKFAVMGFLDGVSGIMQTFATNYLDGGLVILLQQSAIPISMLLSWWLLKAKYKLQHYIGAFTVFVGLVIVIVPTFVGKHDDGENQISATKKLIWILVFVLSCVPMTLSSVYKERALGDVEMDVVYLNGWVAVYQFLTSIPFAIPAAYATPGLKIKDIPTTIKNGLLCYGGKNSIMVSTKDVPMDACHDSPMFVNIYLVFNILYNVLIILILKHGSANLLFLALTIMVPMGNATFALKFIPNHKAMKPTDIVGLIVIMGGLTCYRFLALFLSWCGITEKQTAAEGKKKLYITGNQVEAAEGVIETMEQRVVIVRNSATIRSAYLSRLGFAGRGSAGPGMSGSGGGPASPSGHSINA